METPFQANTAESNTSITKKKYALVEKELKLIGNLLWNIRTSTQFTQGDVASKINSQQSFISSLESANTKRKKIPSLLTLVRYLDAIGYELVIRKKAKPK